MAESRSVWALPQPRCPQHGTAWHSAWCHLPAPPAPGDLAHVLPALGCCFGTAPFHPALLGSAFPNEQRLLTEKRSGIGSDADGGTGEEVLLLCKWSFTADGWCLFDFVFIYLT